LLIIRPVRERGKHAAEYGAYESEPVRPIERNDRGAGRE
jgi:hypothetical protein